MHRTAFVGFVLSALAVSGCQPGAGPQLQANPKKGTPAVASTGVLATDRVAASSVRERALVVIEREAKNEDAAVRANAVEAASRAPGRLRSVLEAGLNDPNPAVRSVAAMAVGKAKVAPLAGRARGLLNDSQSHVRASAVYALARNGQDVDQSPLATMLLSDPSIWVRRHAAFILGELGNPSALPLLKEAARKRMPGASASQQKILELHLAEAMVKLGDADQRPVIRASLYPSAPEELEATAFAVQIIGEIKDREAAKQLVTLSAYRDPQGNLYPPEIRLAIASSMASLGDPAGDFLADEVAGSTNPAIRAQAALVYGKTGTPENLGKLDALLDDPNGQVRVAAAAAVLDMLSGGRGSAE